MHVHFWPGEYVAISGLRSRVKSAKVLKTGTEVRFTQDDFQTKFIGLPEKAPDYPITTIAIECESEPTQDTDYVRISKPRGTV
jgi:alpha-L-fucosidase